MKGLKKFESEIISLARTPLKLFGKDAERLRQLAEESKEVFAPLIEGTIDRRDLEAAGESFYNKFSSELIACFKEQTEILVSHYEQLKDASDDDWAAYARMRVRVAFTHQYPVWQRIVKGLVSRAQEPHEVTIIPPVQVLPVGGKSRFDAVARDPSGKKIDDAKFTWYSGDPAIAKIDETGEFEIEAGAAAGAEVEIWAVEKATEKRGSAKVRVEGLASRDQESYEVKVTPPALMLAVGATSPLTAVLYDRDGNIIKDRKFNWRSTDTAVATVDETGAVTAVGAGIAEIVAVDDLTNTSAVGTVTVV